MHIDVSYLLIIGVYMFHPSLLQAEEEAIAAAAKKATKKKSKKGKKSKGKAAKTEL